MIGKMPSGPDKKEFTGNWDLNYKVSLTPGNGDKLYAKLNESAKGVHLLAGGSIPGLTGEQMDAIENSLSVYAETINGLDASDPESHIRSLRAIAEYCNNMAASIEGE